MNIFDNLIKDQEIVGIGALSCAESTPGSPNTTELQYSFRVFTKASFIMIYSPAFTDKQAENKDAWLKKYLIVRQQISVQIGELQTNS